jgi:hypothetical protein
MNFLTKNSWSWSRTRHAQPSKAGDDMDEEQKEGKGKKGELSSLSKSLGFFGTSELKSQDEIKKELYTKFFGEENENVFKKLQSEKV